MQFLKQAIIITGAVCQILVGGFSLIFSLATAVVGAALAVVTALPLVVGIGALVALVTFVTTLFGR